MTALTPAPAPATSRPSIGRRIAVVAAGVPACALPLMWTISTVGELVTGAERDHLFHQLTGQGLLLGALWLGGLLPLLVAGWRGRRPGPAPALLHASVAGAAVVAGGLAPGNGGVFVAGIAVVTGALVWLALPVRPRIAPSGLDPVLAPLALAAAAVVAPFVLGQSALQRAMGNEHASFSHYFDMAWIGTALVLAAVAAALVPDARRLAVWALAGLAFVGAARYAFTPDVVWSLGALALGIAGAVAAGARLARRAG